MGFFDFFRSKSSSSPSPHKLQQSARSIKFDDNDPYLRFDGPIRAKTPKELIPFLDVIRRESEWKKLGMVKKGQYGDYKTIMGNGLCYGFDFILEQTCKDIERAAIITGKKCTSHPDDVFQLLQHGCTYDDFVAAAKDVKGYCEARDFIEKERYDEALESIKKAIGSNPSERRYKELFYSIFFQRKDTSAIDGHIAFYIESYGGVSSMIHDGHVEKWLKLLYSLGEHAATLKLIDRIGKLLEDEYARTEASPRKVKRYPGAFVNGVQMDETVIDERMNRMGFIRSKQTDLDNIAAKYRERIQKKAQRKGSKK